MSTFDIPNVIKAFDPSVVIEGASPEYGTRTPPRGFTLAGNGLSAEEERLARSTAAHEAGHDLIAEHYGLKPQSWLAAPGEGVCLHCRGTDDEVAEAVGWAGIVAEDLLGARKPGRLLPGTILATTSGWEVFDWSEEVRGALRRNDFKSVGLSRSDQRFIDGFSKSPVPLRVFRLLSARLGELKELAGDLYATFRPALVQARDLDDATVQASVAEPAAGDQKADYYGQAVSRMMKTEARAGETEQEAGRLSREADEFSRHIVRLGTMVDNRTHFEAALEHITAMEALREAAAAAEGFNAGWAGEFCKLRAAGDTAGARRAAYTVELRTPRYLKKKAEDHKAAALFHRGKAGPEAEP